MLSNRTVRSLASIIIGSAVGMAASLSACSLDVPKSRGNGVRIIIDDPNKNAALAAPMLNSFEALLFSPHILGTNPTATSDFTCFAVNVTGNGIPSDSKQLQNCTSATNMQGVGVGSLSQTTPRGTPIEMNVIGGPARTFDVYGVFPPDQQNCGGAAGGSGSSGGNGGGGGYFLGRTVKDLGADSTVTIGINYAGANPDVVCTGGSGGSGGNNGGGLSLASPFPYTGRATGGWVTQIRGSGMTATTVIQLIASTGGTTYNCASAPTFVSAGEIDCTMPSLPVDNYSVKATDGIQNFTSSAVLQMQSGGSYISVDQNTSNTNFGSVANGSSKSIFVHFANAGNATSGSIGTPNFASSPFSIVSGNCSYPSGTLAQDGQCTAEVKFSPVSTGPFSVTPSFFGIGITFNGTGI